MPFGYVGVRAWSFGPCTRTVPWIIFCAVGHHDSSQSTVVGDGGFVNRYVFAVRVSNFDQHWKGNLFTFGLVLPIEADLCLIFTKPFAFHHLIEDLLEKHLRGCIWSAVTYGPEMYALICFQATPPCQLHIHLALCWLTTYMLIFTPHFGLNMQRSAGTMKRFLDIIDSILRI